MPIRLKTNAIRPNGVNMITVSMVMPKAATVLIVVINGIIPDAIQTGQ